MTAGLAVFLAACETTRETSDGRPMPPTPRNAPTTPSEAPINAIAVVLGPKALDSNNNLFPDTIQLEAYLFARPYPTPVWRDGTFEFAIYPSGAAPTTGGQPQEPLRTWTITPEELRTVRSKSLVGECYAIALSLLVNGGTDRLNMQAVDLVATFKPADGGPAVPLNGVRSMSMAPIAVQQGR